MDHKHVAYYRVSTERQGRSGLGLEAQKHSVAAFLGSSHILCGEFTEIESGGDDDRPELAKAIAACRVHRARLVIAKLDRLSRDAHFLLGLEKAGVDFVAADMPNANRVTVGIMAVIAEDERRSISKRTKEALAAAKVRGKVLGGFRGKVPSADHRQRALAARRRRAEAWTADLRPVIANLQAKGVLSLRGLAQTLTERGIPTAQGGKVWTATQVRRVLASDLED